MKVMSVHVKVTFSVFHIHMDVRAERDIMEQIALKVRLQDVTSVISVKIAFFLYHKTLVG